MWAIAIDKTRFPPPPALLQGVQRLREISRGEAGSCVEQTTALAKTSERTQLIFCLLEREQKFQDHEPTESAGQISNSIVTEAAQPQSCPSDGDSAMVITPIPRARFRPSRNQGIY